MENINSVITGWVNDATSVIDQITDLVCREKKISMTDQFDQLTAACVHKYRLHPMPSDEVFDEAIEQVSLNARKNAFVNIFNPDQKRSQKFLASNNQFLNNVVVPGLCKIGATRNRKIGQAFVLQSKRNCSAQPWHVDYQPMHVRGLTTKPLACLFALEKEGTEFWCVVKGIERHIKLKRGEFVVFDGDLIHAGAAYKKKNIRIHLYIDVEGVHIGDETFLVDMNAYSKYLGKEKDRAMKEMSKKRCASFSSTLDSSVCKKRQRSAFDLPDYHDQNTKRK